MIAPSDLHSLQYVARNMNAMDRREIFATRNVDDPDGVAEQALLSHHSYLCLRSEVPVAAFGASEAWPGVWSVWMFSTDLFDHAIGSQVLRHYRRVILPDVLERGIHRAQCDSLKTHHVAHEFIERFGGKVESVMRGYGRNREDFVRFAWDRASLEAQLPTMKKCGIPTALFGDRRNERPVLA